MSDTRQTIQARVMNRADLESSWQSSNPLLLKGEFAIADVGPGANNTRRYRMKIGDGINHFNSLSYYDESAGAYQGLATTSTVPNVSSGNVWYFAGPGTYNNFLTTGGVPIVVTVPLAILSFNNGVWYKLDVVAASIPHTTTRYIIRAGGTPSVDCDYTSIGAALAAITTNSQSNRFILEVIAGEYIEEIGHDKDYVDIIGSPMNTGKVIVRNIEAASAGAEAAKRTIRIAATCTIKNISFYGYKGYTTLFIADSTKQSTELTIENCEFIHFGGQAADFRTSIIVPYYNQKINIVNCLFSGAQTNLSNQSSSTNRANDYGFNIKFQGCKIQLLNVDDYLQYSRDTLELFNNVIYQLKLNADLTEYNANPSNPVMNRGFYPPLIGLREQGNRIGEVEYLNDYITVNANRRRRIEGYSKPGYNAGGSSILQGVAVIKVANASLPNTYTAGDYDLLTEQVEGYSGAGRVYGFAEENILTGDVGNIIEFNRDVIINGKFDNVNGSVALGDALELTATGLVAKLSAGTKIAHATQADSGGFVKFQLI